MKPTHQFRPRLEQLDSRDLPSGSPWLAWYNGALASLGTGHPTPPAAVGAGHGSSAQHQNLALKGTVTGTWTAVPSNPDTGGQQDLTGAGTVKPLGTVQASGSLHTPGFIRDGHATGTIVLTNASGSVTLSLVGPRQPGFSPPPSSFTYEIVSGTGAYAGATGHGTATFAETDVGTFSMTF